MPVKCFLRDSMLSSFLNVAAVLLASPFPQLLAFQGPAVIQLSPSTAPVAAEPNVTSVSLTGSGYPAGTINSGQVTVQLQPQAPATGPAMSANVTGVKTVLGNTRKIIFTVVPSNTANNVTVPTNYLVSVSGSTTGGATFASANSATMVINPPASIASVSPAKGMQGQSFQITITGSFSNFTQGSSLATLGPGISVGGAAEGALGPITVSNNTSATAQISIDSAATLGSRSVSVSTGIEVAAETGGFQVIGVPVPNVVGDTQAVATSALTTAQLKVGTVTTASSSSVPSGEVISESPAAGTSVNLGSAVNLVISSGPAKVSVPNVVGDTQAAATTAITGAGLVVGTVTQQSSSTVAAGDVISESPASGTSVNVGSAVNLVISSGPAKVSVPNVVGDTQAAATTAITGAGLVVGTVTQQSSSTVAAGDVISESPVAGTSVNVGSAVNLVVSSGPAKVSVPNVIGDTQAAATTAITGAGLVLGTVTQQSSSTVASGDVISESPAAGTSVNVGSAVNLVISSGPAQVSVPNVVGDTHAVATSAITGVGLVVGTVTQQSSSTVAAGDVISESPVAGTGVNVGSAVNLVVSSGPAKVSVPNVIGDTQATATTAITGAGLVLGTVTQQSSGTVAAGDVISESPAAGTSVNVGSAVNLVVSSGPAKVSVPNVVGDTQAAATTAITGAGLVVGTVTQQSSSTVAAGDVISENPVAGTSVNVGSSVNLVVSTGPAQVSVPNVVGDTQAVATSAITGVGLVLGTITQQSSSTVASGDVISESPVAGTSVNVGSAVNLVVSSGALPASIASATPNTVPQGAQNVTITLIGLNTHFTAGVSQASFGAGITVVSTFVVNSTSVKATINVDAAATVGGRTATVTTNAEVASLANGLSVEASAATPPAVAITSPTAGQTLNAATSITGTVSGAGTVTWTLDYAIGTSANFTTIATGSGAVNGTLGTFAADLLANDPYTLRLTASNGQSVNTTVAVVVNSGVTKMGSVTLTYQDLTLPGLGFPIGIRRVYDSTNPNSSDFGFGWSLGYSSVDITTDANFNVFLTLPNGKRTAFAFTPSCSFFGCTNLYTAPPGIYYSIQDNDGCPDVFFSGGIWFCGLGGPPYNPQNYILTAPNGTKYSLTASGGVTGITELNGKSITIGASGVITNFGKSVVFTRDGSGRITTITDPNNNKLQYSYDSLGRLIQVIYEKGNVSTYSYAGSSTLISNVNAPGNCQPVSNQYDSEGRVISSTDASGNVTTNTYDSTNNSETITNPLGGVSTYHYDTNGNLLEVDDPEGGKTSYTYDSNNNITLITFPSGREISETYDSNGNLLTKTVVPTSGPSLTTTYTWTVLNQLASAVSPSGSQQLYQYDGFGNLTSRAMVNSSNTVLYSESFTYDANANQITRTDGLGNITNYTYDSVGNLLKQTDPTGVSTSYTYDTNGNVLSKTDGLGNTTSYQYDQANNLIATTFGGQTLSSSTWDSQAKLLSFTDGLGNTTTYGHDCSENLTKVVDPLTNSTSYTYNGLLAITGETDPNNHSTSYAYDQLDRYISRTTPDGTSTKYAYNADSGVSQTTLPNGVVQQDTYDLYGRVVTETAPEKTIGYSFDLDGNITQTQETTASSTRTSTSTYDGIDRLATYTDWAGRTVSYTYDNDSNPLTLTAPDGVITTNSYDNAGRLSKVQMGTASVQYTYDGDGRKSLETYSNGITSAYAYDARGRLTSVTIKNAANTVIESYAYTVDANSNRTAVTLPDGAVTFQYDADQRLTKEQSTSISLGAYTHTESYDGAGNRLDTGDTFGPDNRLLTDSGGAYTYDNNGNRTGRGTQTYGYDSYNRLTSYATSGAAATYEYDWEGRRVAKVVNGARREFVYDHARIIAEYNSGAAVAHYAFGAGTDEVAIVNRGGANYFYHQDGLGSVAAITDSNGNVVQRYGYDAWGNIRQNSGSFAFSGSGLVNDFTYAGREYDNESALYYYRARSYDPVIGRFLQKDPLQGQLDDPQTRNHYAYAGNSPVNRTDPSGEEEVVGEVGTLNSGVNQAAAAFVGFFAGFGLTNLEFLGQYLGLVNEGVSGPTLDAAALALTAARVTIDEETLGIVVSDIGKLNPPGPAAGLPGAFATGFDLKQYLPGLAQKILDTLSALGIPVQTSFGGFQNGAAAAYQRLEQEFQ